MKSIQLVVLLILLVLFVITTAGVLYIYRDRDICSKIVWVFTILNIAILVASTESLLDTLISNKFGMLLLTAGSFLYLVGIVISLTINEPTAVLRCIIGIVINLLVMASKSAE